MPPLIGIDRGLNGEALKALEESGHGRRLAIVDASYNIPRWAQVVDYRGESSAKALRGILELVTIDEGAIDFMAPDESREGCAALTAFNEVIDDLHENDVLSADVLSGIVEVPRLDDPSTHGLGFYTVANNRKEDTLYVRTPDNLPYACATFVIGHAQTGE